MVLRIQKMVFEGFTAGKEQDFTDTLGEELAALGKKADLWLGEEDAVEVAARLHEEEAITLDSEVGNWYRFGLIVRLSVYYVLRENPDWEVIRWECFIPHDSYKLLGKIEEQKLKDKAAMWLKEHPQYQVISSGTSYKTHRTYLAIIYRVVCAVIDKP